MGFSAGEGERNLTMIGRKGRRERERAGDEIIT